MNKRSLALTVYLIIVLGVLIIGFIAYEVLKPERQAHFPLSSGSIVSANDEVFYYAGNIYGYNLITNATQTLISLDPADSDTNFLQRVTTSTLAFGTANPTSSVIYVIYLFDTTSGKLTKELDAASFIDNLDFISPAEFAYSEPTLTSTFGYDNIFLSQDGTITQIGHLLPPVEYGSSISHSPDGKYLFFADEIYDTATGKWQPISSNQNCTIGSESAWLNDNVIALFRQDDGGGLLCTYNVTSHAVRNLGYVQSFGVSGNDIFYDAQGTAAPYLFQIWDYDYDQNMARLIIPNAELLTNIPTLHALIYQPVMPKAYCDSEDCIEGVASGSLMRFDLETRKSYSIMTGVTGFGMVF